MNYELEEKLMRANNPIGEKYRELIAKGLTHKKAVKEIYGKKTKKYDNKYNN